MPELIDRRNFLGRSVALGSVATSTAFMPSPAFASALPENRLVIIVLRGAMDGLDAVRPIGDRNFLRHRPNLDIKGQVDLDGFFALPRGLRTLRPLWEKEELAIIHAASTPYRKRRSHFTGQSLLESGQANDGPLLTMDSSGWLNRSLPYLGGRNPGLAFAVGLDQQWILRGPNEYSGWTPGLDLELESDYVASLKQIYSGDPLFERSVQSAISISRETRAVEQARSLRPVPEDKRNSGDIGEIKEHELRSIRAAASFTADRLNQNTRVATFSISGWDTHAAQDQRMDYQFARLSAAIWMLRERLGDNWGNTAVLCVTEFGRAVRINGSGGTDHGTGGAVILAGGAIRGRRVYRKWPGLDDGDLYDGRDLMPTIDTRQISATVLYSLFGINRATLEGEIFPDFQMEKAPPFIA